MVLTAGENVYSVEVERVLNDHADVRYAAIFGVPNAMLGELVKAVVVLEPGRSISAKTLRSFCATRLADYKCPREIEFIAEAEMPMTGSGKVAKNELKRREAGRSSSSSSPPSSSDSAAAATVTPFGQSLLEIQWKSSPLARTLSSMDKKHVAIYCRRETEELACTQALLGDLGAKVVVISDLKARGCNDTLSKADHVVFFHSAEQHKEVNNYLSLRTDLLQHFLVFSQALVAAKAKGQAWLFTRGAAVEMGSRPSCRPSGGLPAFSVRNSPSLHRAWSTFVRTRATRRRWPRSSLPS